MYIYYLFNYLFIYFASFIYEFIYWHLLSISSIEFQGKRCDLNFLAHKHYSQTQGYRMRLLSSTFSPNGLGYKMPTSIFTSLQKGRILCHKMPISLVTNLQKEKKTFATKSPRHFQQVQTRWNILCYKNVVEQASSLSAPVAHHPEASF